MTVPEVCCRMVGGEDEFNLLGLEANLLLYQHRPYTCTDTALYGQIQRKESRIKVLNYNPLIYKLKSKQYVFKKAILMFFVWYLFCPIYFLFIPDAHHGQLYTQRDISAIYLSFTKSFLIYLPVCVHCLLPSRGPKT